MKRFLQIALVLSVVLSGTASAWGQINWTDGTYGPDQMKNCQHWLLMENTILGIQAPSETCAIAFSFMSTADKFDELTSGGEVLFEKAGGNPFGSAYLPPRIRSEFEMGQAAEVQQTFAVSLAVLKSNQPYGSPAISLLESRLLPDQIALWTRLREYYCYYNPTRQYRDLHRKWQPCFEVPSAPNDKVVEADWSGFPIKWDGWDKVTDEIHSKGICQGDVGMELSTCLEDEMRKDHLRLEYWVKQDWEK
jgi:hypothetical protein